MDETDLEIDAVLPKKRARKKKSIPAEQCEDEAVLDEVDSYRMNTFNAIIDRVVQNLKVRFLDHEMCYKAFACFDPRRFSELKQSGIPPSATGKVCELLGDRVDRELLLTQVETVYGFLLKACPVSSRRIRDRWQWAGRIRRLW